MDENKEIHSNTDTNTEEKGNKKKRRIVFWIAILILALCVGYISYYLIGKYQREQVYDNLAKQIKTEEPKNTEPEDPETDSVEIPIDFATLQQQYPDLYAWIEIPNTQVAYPIMQSATDNSYYLDYTIDGVKGYPGSIYTENYNSKDFTDFNTVIYGHNMKDGSMFGDLKEYASLDYFNQHRDIIIYTPEHKYSYKVFAAVLYDDRHIILDFDFNDKTQRQNFLTSVTSLAGESNPVASDVTVNSDSRIITLSTCTSQPTRRFIIEAVLVNEQ